ncbi:MAG: 3-phosphoshikimate 1-carboxyvinyltransferase [Candidatus Melainabacteria bacterium]
MPSAQKSAENSLIPLPAAGQPLQGSLVMPGDKSVSHRALMLAGITPGCSPIHGLAPNADVLATQACMAALGAHIETEAGNIRLRVTGARPLQPPSALLDAQNAGTCIRLLSGILAAQPFTTTIGGDDSLSRRPMGRIIEPLSRMGAGITAREGGLAPLTIEPAHQGLHGIDYTLPVASAQVKSAILLAGLFAPEPTTVREPVASRDHTERLFEALGLDITVATTPEGRAITLAGNQADRLQPMKYDIPGDFSSAAFFLVAAACLPGSEVTLSHVGLNVFRTGLLQALQSVGAEITVTNERLACGEPVGDLVVRGSRLRGDITLNEPDLPALIDEIPILAVAAYYLQGTLTVRGAAELRKKESDRIEAIRTEFEKLGIPVTVFEDGLSITGRPETPIDPPGTALAAWHDHRIAMALHVMNVIEAGRHGAGLWPMQGREWMSVSYPQFDQALASLYTQ